MAEQFEVYKASNGGVVATVEATTSPRPQPRRAANRAAGGAGAPVRKWSRFAPHRSGCCLLISASAQLAFVPTWRRRGEA